MGTGTVQVIIIYIVIMGIIILPQILTNRKKKQKQQAMMDSLQTGDKIITIGGIHGTVVTVSEDTADVRIDKNVKMTIAKTAIANVIK